MRIKQFCNRTVRDLAMALRARKVSGSFEKRAAGRGHRVVVLGKTLYSHGASLHPGVVNGYQPI